VLVVCVHTQREGLRALALRGWGSRVGGYAGGAWSEGVSGQASSFRGCA
jgi:hypothetical protein